MSAKTFDIAKTLDTVLKAARVPEKIAARIRNIVAAGPDAKDYFRNFRNDKFNDMPAWAQKALEGYPEFQQVDLNSSTSGARYWTGQSWTVDHTGRAVPVVIAIYRNLTTELDMCRLTPDGVFVPTLTEPSA